jgi:hypothetical protein
MRKRGVARGCELVIKFPGIIWRNKRILRAILLRRSSNFPCNDLAIQTTSLGKMAAIASLGVLAGVGGLSSGLGFVALALDSIARFYPVDEL